MTEDRLVGWFPIFCFIIFYLETKSRYIALGFKRSGTWAKKKKWYKNNWNFIQRVFLIPLFSKEDSTRQYFILGIINYIHLAVGIYTSYVFFHNGWDYYRNTVFWKHPFIIYASVFFVHYIVLYSKSNESLKRIKSKKKTFIKSESLYSQEYRDSITKRILEEGKPLSEVVEETGISQTTISNWIRSYKNRAHNSDE